jgi:hypothetical protein
MTFTLQGSFIHTLKGLTNICQKLNILGTIIISKYLIDLLSIYIRTRIQEFVFARVSFR